MAKKKADKKVDEVKEELEEVIDLDDYDEDEDLDEEFDMEEEIEEDVVEDKDNPEETTLEDRVIAIEKKANVVLALSVLVAILTAITMCVVLFGGGKTKEKDAADNTNEQGQQQQQQTQEYDYDVSAFKEVKAKELSGLSKGKTILVYIGRETCGYCIQFVPILTQIQEKYNKYTTYYIDIAKIYDYANGVILDEESESIMINFKTVDKFKDMMKQDFGSTPMTLVIKDNKIVDAIVGYVDANTLDSLVKDNGLNK